MDPARATAWARVAKELRKRVDARLRVAVAARRETDGAEAENQFATPDEKDTPARAATRQVVRETHGRVAAAPAASLKKPWATASSAAREAAMLKAFAAIRACVAGGPDWCGLEVCDFLESRPGRYPGAF